MGRPRDDSDAAVGGSPTTSLTGARLKLKRARDHLYTLGDELAAFNAGEPFKIVHEPSSDGSEHVFRAQILREPPPVLSVIIGDALQNMRSALEHLAWGLTPEEDRRKSERSIGFPVYTDERAFFQVDKNRGTYSTRSGAHKIRAMESKARTAIAQLQPYKSKDPHEHPLWLLNELARTDRHQSLRLVGAFANPITQSWRKRGASGGFDFDLSRVQRTEINLGPFEQGKVVGYFLFNEPGMEVNLQVSRFVAFSDEGTAKGRHALGTLTTIRRHIESVVFPKLERFF